MRILAIRGSLRAASINAAILEAVALLAPAGLNIVQYGGLAELPIFNPDLDTDSPPDPVRRLREEVGLSDGLLIASPEYAHGVAGGLKNALDWLVGGPEFYQKPVAVLNASARAVHADAHLRETLVTMAARVIEPASITLGLPAAGVVAAGIVADPLLRGELAEALRQFAEAIQGCAEPVA
ncbi:MAG TPA: NADPH-dependent FMN reductase [Methylocystis sp.]|jgi:NAD(P)H-dependent FMN reductase